MTREQIFNSAKRVEKWIEDHKYKGYEAFDGLSSYLRPLTFGTQFGEQVLQQIVRQSPINLRPLLGVKPQESTKGRGYIVWGYLYMYKLTGEEEYKRKAILSLDWLDKNKSPLYPDHSWGNHFDYASRGGKMPKHTSTIVWTSLIGQVFLDAFEIIKEPRYKEIAESICKWIIKLPREETPSGTCLSYVVPYQSSIHNSNMLGAAMLARTAKIQGGNAEYLEIAHKAMEYSCNGQLPDGAWYYGEDPKYHWIDNFHTGYNLDSLKRYIQFSGDYDFQVNLEKGYKFFRDHFFEPTGRPKYYYNRAYPIDIQCASQAIDTLLFFSDMDSSSVDVALKVAEWTIDNMQNKKSGHFYFRVLPLRKIRVPLIHWGQATMYKALSYLLLKIQR